MVYRDLDKQALKENGYTVLSKITIVETNTVFTEDDFIVNWNYEDYRYVPNNGFIGQFVERILDGNLQNISENVSLEDKEINLQIGIVNKLDDQTTWYDYGNFLITKVEKTDTTGNYKFESSDYTKKFNNQYEDTISYPCIAMELANNVCGQAGVYLDTVNYAYYYIVTEDGLTAGNYSFKINNVYYRFTLSEDLIKNDVLMFIASRNQFILKKVRDNVVSRTLLEYSQSASAGTYTLLDTKTTDYINFTNNDFVIENNQYEEKDTLRKVMQDIGKLAYSWVRIGEDNKVHIDFEQVGEGYVEDYDKLTTDEYFVSKKSDLPFGPVNKVVLGMSNIEGESLYKTSQDYTEETESAIRIFDNNLTYTEELRAIALNGCERLFGLKYTPIEIDTIGHPWLDGDELIKLTNVDEEEVYTYPFNRSISYAGYIESKIGAEGNTKQDSKYEYESEIVKQINKTSIVVDKNNQTITSLVSDVSDAQDKITTLEQTTDSINATVSYLNNEYENTVIVRREAEGNPIEIDNAGNYPLEDFKIYGNTYQETTTGIQTLNLPNTTMTGNGITLTISNGEISITGTATANAFLNIVLGTNLTWTNGEKYTIFANNSVANSNVSIRTYSTGTNDVQLNSVNKIQTFTYSTNSNVYTDRIIIRISSGASFSSAYKFKPMLIKGDNTSINYEPYTYGASPNPDYPQEVETITSKKNTTSYEGINIDLDYDYDGDLEKVERNDFDFKGDTTQETTTGKNYFNHFTYPTNETLSGVTITNNGDGSFTLNGTCSTTGTPLFSLGLNSVVQNLAYSNQVTHTAYYVSGSFTKGASASSTRGVIRVNYNNSTSMIPLDQLNSNNKTISKIQGIRTATDGWSWGIVLGNGDVYNNFTIKYQLEVGSSATSYEPYTYGASPNPNYPQPIEVVTGRQEIDVIGKNLFDEIWEQGSISSTTGVDTSSTTALRSVGYTKIQPNTTYTISRTKVGNTLVVREYDENKNFVGSQSPFNGFVNDYNKSFTTPNNVYYVRLVDFVNDNTNKVMIEKSSSVSTYEPYQGKSYEINLGKNLAQELNGLWYNSNSMIYQTNPICYGFYTKVQPNTTYTISKKNIGNRFVVITSSNIPANNNSISRIVVAQSDSSTKTYTFKTQSNENYVFFGCYRGENSSEKQLACEEVQIEKGNVATSYAPYIEPIELCKIGDYQDEIRKGTGKNLLNMPYQTRTHSGLTSTFDGTNWKCTGTATSTSHNATDNFTMNLPKGTYTLSLTQTLPRRLIFRSFDSTGSTQYSNFEIPAGDTSTTITIDGNEGLWRFIFNPANGTTYNIDVNLQLEEGSIATEYEPYGFKDKWYLHKEIGKVVLDGSENWSINGTDRYKIEVESINGNWSIPCYCNSFKNVIDWDTHVNTNYSVCIRNGNWGENKARFSFLDQDFSTITAWKNYVTNNNIILYYPLDGHISTPTNTEITNEELINQLDDVNELEFFSGKNHYITSSANLPITSNFSIYDLPYKLITIKDENNSQLSYRPLFRNLELCKIGNYQDYLYLKNGKWYKHSEIGKIVLDGSESWSKSSTTNIDRFYIELQKGYLDSYNKILAYSNYYKYTTNLSVFEVGNMQMGSYQQNTRLFLDYSVYNTTTLEQFKTWLSTHNTEVYYVLADSKETEITDEEIVSELNSLMQTAIYEGYNKIYLHDELCEKLYIKYLTDSMFNDTYATKAQLAITNENVSAVVSRSDTLENNIAQLQIDVDGITTNVESVTTLTTDLENSINYLAVDMSANSIIIPTNEENLPYLSTTYTIPFTATFKGNAVNPTVSTSSATITGITLTFDTGVINVGVSSTTAIENLSNSFVINFSYVDNGETYLVSRTLNVALSVKGEDGKDGTSVTILGSYNTLQELQAAHPIGSAGDSYMVGDDLYVWNVSSLAWVDVGQIKGDDGVNAYLYIRYSENANGNPMVTVPTTSTKYIGVCSTTSSTAPTSYSSYTWSKYSGNDGQTTYLHVKYSEDGATFVPASADADEGDTPSAWVGILTDTNQTASTTFTDYAWYKFTEDIDDQIRTMQSDISQNTTNISNNYGAIIEQLNNYAKSDVVATLTKRVETIENDDAFVINAITDLQVNGVSQVRTEKGFTFNNNGMTIDANNSVTKSITDTNGIQVLDKSGSSESELLFAGYDETTQTSIVRTENLAVRTYFNIGTKSRFEDYGNGTGVFI